MQTKKWAFVVVLVLLCYVVKGQRTWKLVEETLIKGSISGTITEGYILKTASRDFYVINERTRQRVRTRNPSVKIFESETDYRLEIQGFEESVICKKLKDVIETQIEGEFKGWEGETKFKMLNGQIWQQSSYAYLYHYAYSPNVLIYQFKGVWIMRVEEVDQTIEVKNLK
jgi:hypothetical protein